MGITGTRDGRLLFVQSDGRVVCVTPSDPQSRPCVVSACAWLPEPRLCSGVWGETCFVGAANSFYRVSLAADEKPRVLFRAKVRDDLVVDPRGGHIVITHQVLANEHYDGVLRLRPLASPKPRVVWRASCGAWGSLSRPAYAPDGSHIAVGCSWGHVHLLTNNAQEEEGVGVIRHPEHFHPHIAWSANGRVLAVGAGYELRIVDVATRSVIRTFDRLHDAIYALAASPDTRRLLVNTHAQPGTRDDARWSAAIFDFGSPNFGTSAAEHWSDASFG
ncbi:hypothetical protein HYV74_03540 [Candidatus Uhrbacteria bacterium]|nr:hypothetical protein [Candidatus Uhrbacteria bacterium]